MKQHQLSAGKRLTKPILFGTLIVGLATAFFNRYGLFHTLFMWVTLTLPDWPVIQIEVYDIL